MNPTNSSSDQEIINLLLNRKCNRCGNLIGDSNICIMINHEEKWICNDCAPDLPGYIFYDSVTHK